MQLTSCLKCKWSDMLTWDLLVQRQGLFPSMHTHHAWVLLEKFLSSDFWLLENLGCYTSSSTLGLLCHSTLFGYCQSSIYIGTSLMVYSMFWDIVHPSFLNFNLQWLVTRNTRKEFVLGTCSCYPSHFFYFLFSCS